MATNETDGPRLADLGAHDAAWDEGAFAVLAQLRPELTRDRFARLLEAAGSQGLTFTGAFEPGGRCVGLAGWRIVDTTHVLRKLYVDDLVVDAEHRSTGVGSLLLAHLEERARAAGCHVIDLDSGHQRRDAHRFYRREGYTDVSAHFAKRLDPA